MSIVKTSFYLNKKQVKDIEEIAKNRKTSMSDVIRSAISTEKFIFDEINKGSNILIEKNCGCVERIIWK